MPYFEFFPVLEYAVSMHFSRSEEKEIRSIFIWAIVLKGIAGVIELVAGAFLFFVNVRTFGAIGTFLTREELLEEPHDALANTVNNFFHHLPVDVKSFGSLYFLVHGAIDVFLVVGLLRNKRWAYPWAIGFILLFIVYQVYRLVFVSFSPLLLGVTIFDTALTVLIWHEWKRMAGSGS